MPPGHWLTPLHVGANLSQRRRAATPPELRDLRCHASRSWVGGGLIRGPRAARPRCPRHCRAQCLYRRLEKYQRNKVSFPEVLHAQAICQEQTKLRPTGKEPT
ncbi:hypothetical protein NDU88_000884 [Pleurodeles waltl]|uniref:Uncharacterized protein n=1 Tax=Pleurodeles waltl TaxID=8319 RepID=A0AAV7TG92_PLEWA|nr:hypothetical protein NDU88_000884 [Pleurodeles waltl]